MRPLEISFPCADTRVGDGGMFSFARAASTEVHIARLSWMPRRVAIRRGRKYTQPLVAGCVRLVTVVCSLLPKCNFRERDQDTMMLHVLPSFLASLAERRVAVV